MRAGRGVCGTHGHYTKRTNGADALCGLERRQERRAAGYTRAALSFVPVNLVQPRGLYSPHEETPPILARSTALRGVAGGLLSQQANGG
jgi:hypothetical protein